MIVDDKLSNIDFLGNIVNLLNTEYKVNIYSALDGGEAVDKFKEKNY